MLFFSMLASLLVKCKTQIFRTERVKQHIDGFKTAVQKAAFKHEQVIFLHTSNFTSVTSVCCISPSLHLFFSLPPPSLLLLFPLIFPLANPSTAAATQENGVLLTIMKPVQDSSSIQAVFTLIQLN